MPEFEKPHDPTIKEPEKREFSPEQYRGFIKWLENSLEEIRQKKDVDGRQQEVIEAIEGMIEKAKKELEALG